MARPTGTDVTNFTGSTRGLALAALIAGIVVLAISQIFVALSIAVWLTLTPSVVWRSTAPMRAADDLNLHLQGRRSKPRVTAVSTPVRSL